MSDKNMSDKNMSDKNMSDKNTRRGDWILTFTGREFWPCDAREEEIDINDIAHALSNINRYTGHTHTPLSVARHSLAVSECLSGDKQLELWGLLHDASEAYLGDISSPLKSLLMFEEYRKIEAKLQRLIANRFGLVWPEPAEVKLADMQIFSREVRMFMYPNDKLLERTRLYVPFDSRELYMSESLVESRFLSRFYELTR